MSSLWTCDSEEGKEKDNFLFCFCLAPAALVQKPPRTVRYTARHSREKREQQSGLSEASVKANSTQFSAGIGFWRTPALVQGPPPFVRCFHLSVSNKGGERKGSQSLGCRRLSLSIQGLVSGRGPPVPPSRSGAERALLGSRPQGSSGPAPRARGRGRPGAALFQHGAAGGGFRLLAPVVPAPRILVPE